MAQKNNKFMTSRSKTNDAKPVQKATHVVTYAGAVGPVIRSMTRTSTQSSMEVPSASTPIFSSTSLMLSSPIVGLKNVSVSIEKTLAMLEFGSGSKFSKHDNDDSSSTGSASSHETFQSKFSIEDSAVSSAVISAIMINTLSLEKQVSNISKMMETMIKHIKDEDARITQLFTQKDHAPEGNHLNSKEYQEHEISSSKGKGKVKEVYVTSEGTIPVEQLKEFVEDVIKDKNEVAQSKTLLTPNLTLLELTT